MGWKGAIRSGNAAFKRSMRESERRQREAYRRRIANTKIALQNKAEELVKEHETYLTFITSFHKEISEQIDWNAILTKPKPQKPEVTHHLELKAKEKFENFKPNFFNRLLKNSDNVKARLNSKIAQSREEDRNIYQKNIVQYERDTKDWEESHKEAKLVQDNDFETIQKLLADINPFSDLAEVKIDSVLIYCSNKEWKIESTLNDTNIIRGFEVKLLRSGELTTKPMIKSKVTALIEDVVSSINIRMAREIFTLFPASNLIVNTKMVSRSTTNGRLEPQLVLSCLYNREKVRDIDFNYIDPSDYIKSNVKYNSGFEKTKITSTEEIISE